MGKAEEILIDHGFIAEPYGYCLMAGDIQKLCEEYAREKCKQQRILCANHYTRLPKDFTDITKSILDSPEPKFD